VFAQSAREGAFRALEVYNSLPFLAWANSVAAKLAGGQGIALTGGSDAHVIEAVGKGYTMYRGTSTEDLRRSIDACETRAEAGRGGLSLAWRYVMRYPQIRRMQAWNWERCKAR
jgi:predicted metal-dependent phosphoesterase TrpH